MAGCGWMVGWLYDGWAIGAAIVREGADVVKKFAVVVGLTGLATWKSANSSSGILGYKIDYLKSLLHRFF